MRTSLRYRVSDVVIMLLAPDYIEFVTIALILTSFFTAFLANDYYQNVSKEPAECAASLRLSELGFVHVGIKFEYVERYISPSPVQL